MEGRDRPIYNVNARLMVWWTFIINGGVFPRTRRLSCIRIGLERVKMSLKVRICDVTGTNRPSLRRQFCLMNMPTYALADPTPLFCYFVARVKWPKKETRVTVLEKGRDALLVYRKMPKRRQPKRWLIFSSSEQLYQTLLVFPITDESKFPQSRLHHERTFFTY